MKILYVSVWLREVRREGGLGGGKYDEKKVLKWLICKKTFGKYMENNPPP